MNPVDILRTFAGARKVAVAFVLTAVLLLLFSQVALSAVVTRFEAEKMSESSSYIAVIGDSKASGGQALRYTGRATAKKVVDFPTPTTDLRVRARGVRYNGEWPSVRVFVDGTTVGVHDVATKRVASSSYVTYTFPVRVAAGQHAVYVEALSGANAKRSLVVDSVAFIGNEPDQDGDGIPDGVDSDLDGDGFANGVDSDSRLPDPNQPDLDGDKIGDAFDPTDDRTDGDADGVKDVLDNCPNAANADQGDLDRDGTGDACDTDRDGDGRANGEDFAPDDPNVVDPPPQPAFGANCSGVQASPGQDLAAVAASRPAGTTFCVADGEYLVASRVVAQDGDRFVGVYSDGTRPRIKTATADHVIFVGGADGVLVENLRVEGAVHDDLCEPDCGRGVGGPGSNLTVKNVRATSNENQGVGGTGPGLLIEDSELDHNGTPEATNGKVSAAGVKAVNSFTVRDSYVHDNLWDGVWCDEDCGRLVVENSRIEDNGKAGVHFEITPKTNLAVEPSRASALVAGNTIRGNGYTSAPTRKAEMIIVSSQNADVRDNEFGGSPSPAVLLGDDDRALTANNAVRNNTLNGDDLASACGRFGTVCEGNTP